MYKGTKVSSTRRSPKDDTRLGSIWGEHQKFINTLLDKIDKKRDKRSGRLVEIRNGNVIRRRYTEEVI